MNSRGVFAFALAAGFVAAAPAQTAGMMSFQALLRDAGGAAVSGSVTMQLTIVDSGGAQIDASGNGSVGPEDTFTVNTTATVGVVSVKYGPVAPSAFNGAARYLRATVTAPFNATLADVEIVTPPTIAEQLNARGSGTPAVVAAANGFVGVGTTSPQTTLHVASDGQVLNLEGSTSAYMGLYPAGPATRWGYLGFAFANNTDLFVYNAVPSGQLVLSAFGGVGVNQINPLATLHVSGNLLIDSDGSYGVVRAPSNDRDAFWFGSGLNVNFGIMEFRSTSGATTHAVLTHDGNFGIGTTTPTARLELISTGPLGEDLIRATRSGDALTFGHGDPAYRSSIGHFSQDGRPYLFFHGEHSAATQNRIRRDGTGNGPIGLFYSGGALNIAVAPSGTPNADVDIILAMTWTPAGNVGIGVTNPAARLEVESAPGQAAIRFGEPSGFAYLVAGSDSIQIRRGNGIEAFRISQSTGNVGIGTTSPAHPLQVGVPASGTGGNGAHCTAGGNWTSTSDRDVKADFAPIEPAEILDRVAELPIAAWRYTCEDECVRHIGPTAQDFHAAFGLGESDRHIGMLDADGVALAAIQGLNEKLAEKDRQIRELSARLESIEKLLRDSAQKETEK